jgi:hypothetical protein
MRAAITISLLIALAACQNQGAEENAAANAAAAPADIEALPPDESSATPSDELVNGAVETNDAGTENVAGTENETNAY